MDQGQAGVGIYKNTHKYGDWNWQMTRERQGVRDWVGCKKT